jgi:phage baseplate assembly protein W
MSEYLTDFEKAMPSYRLAKTHHSDTLQMVAYRELGDANRWIELIWMNNLSDPYLTDDVNLVSSSVLLTGSLIRVPAAAGVTSTTQETGQVFERDVALVNRRLAVDDTGDIMTVSGIDNLSEQLGKRLDTPKGQLIRHPKYGCRLHELLGKVTGPAADLLGAQYVKSSLKADYRISSVTSVTGTSAGDSISVVANAMAIDGNTVDTTASTSSPSGSA